MPAENGTLRVLDLAGNPCHHAGLEKQLHGLLAPSKLPTAAEGGAPASPRSKLPLCCGSPSIALDETTLEPALLPVTSSAAGAARSTQPSQQRQAAMPMPTAEGSAPASAPVPDAVALSPADPAAARTAQPKLSLPPTAPAAAAGVGRTSGNAEPGAGFSGGSSAAGAARAPPGASPATTATLSENCASLEHAGSSPDAARTGNNSGAVAVVKRAARGVAEATSPPEKASAAKASDAAPTDAVAAAEGVSPASSPPQRLPSSPQAAPPGASTAASVASATASTSASASAAGLPSHNPGGNGRGQRPSTAPAAVSSGNQTQGGSPGQTPTGPAPGLSPTQRRISQASSGHGSASRHGAGRLSADTSVASSWGGSLASARRAASLQVPPTYLPDGSILQPRWNPSTHVSHKRVVLVNLVVFVHAGAADAAPLWLDVC